MLHIRPPEPRDTTLSWLLGLATLFGCVIGMVVTLIVVSWP